MKPPKVIVETKRFLIPNTIAVAGIAIQIGLLLLFRDLPPQVPLLYSQKWGEERLVPPSYLWLLPTICVGMVITTYGLLRLTPRDKLLQRVIFWTMPIFSLLLLITLVNILIVSS